MSVAILSLGSNMGDRAFYLHSAIALMEKRVGCLLQQTTVHETKAWGYEAPDYLNQLVQIETTLEPIELLEVLKKIEQELGRAPETKTPQGTQNYHDRTIDIDILYYDKLTINTPTLTIPHPQIEKREFILNLLKEIKQ